MADPELRSDEKVLVRTQGVYVKSIPFEGILTNKRIILIDRVKNILPPKEIPLVTIKEVESGENAIRDQIIILSVIAKTGETRQMILTFSRQAGGNRIKERDEWMRVIKENASFSFDQTILKAIPGPEPALGRAEPVAGQRYEIVHSPVRPAAPSDESRPAGMAMDSMNPVRRAGVTTPVTAVPPSPAVRQFGLSPLGTSIFCSKCGNKVPAESVFCNRCGSPISQIPTVTAPVQTPAAPSVVRAPAARPIDEEIQSIEPLMERSTVKIPADALRTAPVETPIRKSFSWDNEEEEPAPAPAEKPAGKGFLPRLFSAKSTEAATPAPVLSYGGISDTPPPPKPPKSRSFMPSKQTILTAAVALVVILLVAAGAFFVYPMLTQDGTTKSGTDTGTMPVITSSIPQPRGTIVVIATTPPVIPATGVYVRVSYLGGWKGTYGQTDGIVTIPGNSGDHIMEVENANATVQATFEKLDGSNHEIIVEIYKDGKVLTRGTTTVGHGSVALSFDTVTGKAAAPVTSGNATVVNPVTTLKTTPAPVVTSTTANPTTTVTANVTTVKTTAAVNTTTAAP